MNAMLPETTDIVARLKDALSVPTMPTREAESCARLIERLTRPVRVGVFGLSSGGNAWLLSEIVGSDVLPPSADWPTLEVVHGDRLVTHATYEDGMTSSYGGAVTEAILAEEPVFLRIEAPIEALRRMRFLYLASDDAPGDQLAALDWAEPRTDISIWATQNFGQAEIAIWAQAPDRMKNHALLVSTSPRQDEQELTQRAGYDFDGVYVVPQDHPDAALNRLLVRLDDDIAEARAADLDAAHMFLHRVRHVAAETPRATSRPAEPQRTASRRAMGFAETSQVRFAPEPEPAPAPPPALQPQPRPQSAPVQTEAAPAPEPVPAPVAQPEPMPAPAPVPPKPVPVAPVPTAPPDPAPLAVARAPSPEMQAMLSEPMLYLKRRARALLEMIEWKAAEEDAVDGDWAEDVLAHCCETTEGLQMRAMDWPEDETSALLLRRTLDEACDVAILLQVEGGTDQAQDAAMMLLQLRGDFERELAA